MKHSQEVSKSDLQAVKILWDLIDPYLVGGMPLFDLADLLTLGGDSIGLLDSLGSTGTSLTRGFSMDCTLS